jgi:O-antigen/teichoic acid export membrane protein
MSGFVLTAFNTAFAPMISNLYEQDKMKELSSVYKIITKWILTINLIAFSFFILFSDEIMLFFGSEFIAGAYALILIGVGQIANVMVGPAGYMLTMTGNPQYSFYINFIVLFLNISLNYFLIPFYGINGAAIASSLSIGLTNIIKLVLVKVKIGTHPYNFSYIKVILANGLSLLLAILVDDYLYNKIHLYLRFLCVSSLFLICFFGIFYLLGFSDEDKFIIKKLHNKLGF